MSKYIIEDTTLTDIADAIREKDGTSALIPVYELGDKVRAIPTGGITPSGQISITENGTFDVTSFASALVNVSGGGDLPDWIEVGEFTPQQNINTYTISHNKGIVPQAVAYVNDDLFSTATYLAKVGFGYKYADGGIGGGCAFNGYNGSFGGFATNYPGVTDMNESTVTIATRSGSYYFKVGYTYKYIIIFKEEE